jgi:type II secretory pathway pseudopilin PulG
MTLVEIILVIGIIGISMGVALPMIVRKPGPVDLRVATATIQSLIRYARNSSIARGLPHRLRYDRGTGRFAMEVEENPVDSPGEYSPHKLPPSIGKEIKKNAIDIVIEYADAPDQPPGAADELLFYPDGSTVDTLVHVTEREDGLSFTVVVVGATGISFTREEVVEFDRGKAKG